MTFRQKGTLHVLIPKAKFEKDAKRRRAFRPFVRFQIGYKMEETEIAEINQFNNPEWNDYLTFRVKGQPTGILRIFERDEKERRDYYVGETEVDLMPAYDKKYFDNTYTLCKNELVLGVVRVVLDYIPDGKAENNQQANSDLDHKPPIQSGQDVQYAANSRSRLGNFALESGGQPYALGRYEGSYPHDAVEPASNVVLPSASMIRSSPMPPLIVHAASQLTWPGVVGLGGSTSYSNYPPVSLQSHEPTIRSRHYKYERTLNSYPQALPGAPAYPDNRLPSYSAGSGLYR